MITATRYHDISCGHRVVGHEGKCRNLHGHNYRFHFEVMAKEGLDELGRVLDFGVIKSRLCMWLEDQWDHKFLLSENDPFQHTLRDLDPSVVLVPFNPTAENMAKHLVEVVAPEVLRGTGTVLIRCTVDETRKCSATFSGGFPYEGE